MTFKGEYFANAELTGVYLKADVTDPDGFTGSSLNCADMKVYATFLEMFYEIEITYVGETGNAVECVSVVLLSEAGASNEIEVNLSTLYLTVTPPSEYSITYSLVRSDKRRRRIFPKT